MIGILWLTWLLIPCSLLQRNNDFVRRIERMQFILVEKRSINPKINLNLNFHLHLNAKDRSLFDLIYWAKPDERKQSNDNLIFLQRPNGKQIYSLIFTKDQQNPMNIFWKNPSETHRTLSKSLERFSKDLKRSPIDLKRWFKDLKKTLKDTSKVLKDAPKILKDPQNIFERYLKNEKGALLTKINNFKSQLIFVS